MAASNVCESEGKRVSGDWGRVVVAVLAGDMLCPWGAVGSTQPPDSAKTSLAVLSLRPPALATWPHAGAGTALMHCILNMA